MDGDFEFEGWTFLIFFTGCFILGILNALRWYFFTASPPGNVRRFSEKLVAEVARRFLLTLWNVYSFFVTYANIDHFTPSSK
ncbi:hypothetical protein LCGC14_2318160, partial [marine sediment metagenome]